MNTPPVPDPRAEWRVRLAARIERPAVQRVLIALIVVNAITLGLETSPAVTSQWGGLLSAIDRAILAVFVVEIGLRLAAHGGRFFRDPWSVFDFVVVAIALLPAAGPFSVLRALRVLRVLRLLTMVPSMRRVVGALLSAIPGMGSVFGVMALIFYVASVMATQLFGDSFPEFFGSLGGSAYTLFQVMTLESWSMGVARPVMEQHPYAWAFFVPFILVATFTMLNLFVAVIVNAIQDERGGAPAPGDAEAVRDELRALRAEVAGLREALARRADS